jgi:hypothetical protein
MEAAQALAKLQPKSSDLAVEMALLRIALVSRCTNQSPEAFAAIARRFDHSRADSTLVRSYAIRTEVASRMHACAYSVATRPSGQRLPTAPADPGDRNVRGRSRGPQNSDAAVGRRARPLAVSPP